MFVLLLLLDGILHVQEAVSHRRQLRSSFISFPQKNPQDIVGKVNVVACSHSAKVQVALELDLFDHEASHDIKKCLKLW